MRYTVVWLPNARNELADVWLEADDRNAVTQTANYIDFVLRNDPEQRGMDFFSNRLLVVDPLAVTFNVSPNDRLVTVLEVKYFKI